MKNGVSRVSSWMHQREHEDLGERTAEVAEAAPQIGEPGGDLGLERLERRGRRQLERNPGKMLAHLGNGDTAAATGGVDDRSGPAGDAFQHHEMVHVPVQDGGLLKLVEFVKLEPDCARCKLQIGRDRHQLLERRAAHGRRIFLPQPRRG